MTWYIQKIACKKHVLKNYDESCGESQQLAFYHCWRLTCNKDSDIHDTTRLSESSDGHLIMTSLCEECRLILPDLPFRM